MTQIMIIEDSPTDMRVLREMLERYGFHILTAANGNEGVEAARREKPDLILMDVVMPGLDGYQATRQLTSSPETASIPVIMVTRKDQQVDRVWAMRQGAHSYLTKPVREDALLGVITDMLTD